MMSICEAFIINTIALQYINAIATPQYFFRMKHMPKNRHAHFI